MKTILKVIVGSQAHGLATPESDFDYRGVFVLPTSEILSLKGNVKTTNWIEDKDDDTAWEIGHFLHLATKCNPTILEVFLAPIVSQNDVVLSEQYQLIVDNKPIYLNSYGKVLRDLFPYIWNSRGVFDAFTGYGFNQRKKFLDNKDNRASKYAAAYLRTLYQGWELLSTGTFTVKIIETEIGETCRRFKNGEFTIGEVVQVCTDWYEKVKLAYERNSDKQTDLEKVDEFLLAVRKNNW